MAGSSRRAASAARFITLWRHTARSLHFIISASTTSHKHECSSECVSTLYPVEMVHQPTSEFCKPEWNFKLKLARPSFRTLRPARANWNMYYTNTHDHDKRKCVWLASTLLRHYFIQVQCPVRVIGDSVRCNERSCQICGSDLRCQTPATDEDAWAQALAGSAPDHSIRTPAAVRRRAGAAAAHDVHYQHRVWARV